MGGSAMAFDTNVPPGQLQFDQILQAEIQAINQRRRFLGRKELVRGASEGKLKTLDAVGLADACCRLSGADRRDVLH